jgi:hypothetical protein
MRSRGWLAVAGWSRPGCEENQMYTAPCCSGISRGDPIQQWLVRSGMNGQMESHESVPGLAELHYDK